MATLVYSIDPINSVNDCLRLLSIRHKKLCFDECLKISGVVKGKQFILNFRNYRKQRYIIYIDEVGIVKYDKNGFITGHDFVNFVKHCLLVTIGERDAKNHYSMFI